jgi:hypothetical protein
MEDKEIITVPYVALESERARCERMLKDERDRHEKERHDERLKSFIIKLVLILLLFGTNAGWLAYESQWETLETITQEVSQEADNGVNRFIGGDYYGTADNQDNQNN